MMKLFRSQCVRDLVWAVSSPPLIAQQTHPCVWPDSRWYRQIFEDSMSWLQQLDRDPAELEALLGAQKDRRLGKVFETLWYYWLTQNPRYEIIENNLQIIIDGETLGELDLIVYDRVTGKTSHWELAVKFYLGVDDTRQLHNWHGPNLRDRLDIKVDHMMHRQSIISRNQRVRSWLQQQGLYIDDCSVILKGRLYLPSSYRLESGDVTHRFPAICSEDRPYAWWYEEAEFKAHFDVTQQFVPLLNSGWLERISTHSVNKFYSIDQIYENESNNKLRLPLHVQLCEPYDSGDRAFLVDKNWRYKTS